MLGFFTNVTKAALKTALVPVTVAQDVVTMGGLLTDKKQSYTSKLTDKIGYAKRREHISRMECGHDPIPESLVKSLNAHLALFRLTRDKKSRKK